jgi:hypothetical protein
MLTTVAMAEQPVEPRLPFAGEEFVVNTTTPGNQTIPDGIDPLNFTSSDPAGPAIDTDDAGNYVVVWTDESDANGDNGIFARGFFANGTERFAQIAVNVANVGVQENPHVAVDADGDFVVVWESDPTGSDLDVWMRGFNADGTQRFAEAQVNTITPLNQEHPRMDMMDNGDFIVAWDSGTDEPTPGIKMVHYRRFNANGTAVDAVGDRIANLWTRGNQRFPDVAFDGSGNYVITWQSGAGGTDVFQDGSISGIFARLFTSADLPVLITNPVGQCYDICSNLPAAAPACTGDELIFQLHEICVNDYKDDTQDLPRVARNDSGDFVITFHSNGSGGVAPPSATRTTDSDMFSVQAKRFNADGSPKTGEPQWQVNTYTGSEQVFPDVAIAAGGSFVISWASLFQDTVSPADCAALNLAYVLPGLCDKLSEVYAEEYNADGTVKNAEFMVNSGAVNPAGMTALDGLQVYPAVDIADSNGEAVAAWSSGPPPAAPPLFPGVNDAQDGSGFCAMGRRAGPVPVELLSFEIE